jgi:hypothetical protein
VSTLALHWSVTVFLLIWGASYTALVVFSFFIASPAHWAKLVSDGRITAEYAQYISEIPAWVIAFSCVAAATRLGGAVALALRTTWAYPIFLASFVFVAVIMFRGFILAGVAQVISRDQIALELAFLGLSMFAVVYSFYACKTGLLR